MFQKSLVISAKEGSGHYPAEEEEALKVDAVLDWYAGFAEAIDVEKVKEILVPQVETWLGENGNKFVCGKFMTIADLVLGAEIMEAKKTDQSICDAFKLTGKWIKKVGEPKMWK